MSQFRRLFIISLVLGVVLTAVSPLTWDNGVNEYFADGEPRQPDGNSYYWRLHGGFYQVYRSHPAWPELNIPAEFTFVPLGIACNIGLYTFLVGTLLFYVAEIRRIRRNNG